MQFLVNYTLNEISSKVLHKIDIIRDNIQVVNTPPNQHSSGVKPHKLYKN